MGDEDKMYSIKEVAAKIDVPVSAVRRLIKGKKLEVPPKMMGRTYVFTHPAFVSMVDAFREEEEDKRIRHELSKTAAEDVWNARKMTHKPITDENRNPKPFRVRAVYVVPSDAVPWEGARRRVQECFEDLQKWFAEETAQHVTSSLSFDIARESDGLLSFRTVKSAKPASDFRAAEPAAFDLCREAAEAEGLRSMGDDDVVAFFFEELMPSGGAETIADAYASGHGEKGQRECCWSSLHLKLARREWLKDETSCKGLHFPEISPEPLDLDDFQHLGDALHKVSGASYGVVAKYLGIALGLEEMPPSTPMDKDRRGYLMGKGFSGIGGFFAPYLSLDFCRLGRSDAAILARSGRMIECKQQE